MAAYVLIVDGEQDYDPPEVYGPFESVAEAQRYAEDYRRDVGLGHLAEATPDNNEAWTEAGWYFAIQELTKREDAHNND